MSGVILRRKAEAGQHLLDARVVGVAAFALEIVLQCTVAGEGFVGMRGVGHQRFEPGKLRLLFEQRGKDREALIPQRALCVEIRFLRQVADVDSARAMK